MNVQIILVLGGATIAMLFIFIFAQQLERTSKTPPLPDPVFWGRTKPLAYVAIVFGAAVATYQLIVAGKLTVFLDVAPVISGIFWLIFLGLETLKRHQ